LTGSNRQVIKPRAARAGTAPSLPEHVKVRLQYLTQEPKHLRSMILAQQGAEPPFVEDVCVLIPHMKVYPMLECFLPAFETLRKDGIVPEKSELQDFRILDRDALTLSYVI
jgi:hypothetical protein